MPDAPIRVTLAGSDGSQGTGSLGNTGSGVQVQAATDNTIGGTVSGAGNIIAFNGDDGVSVSSGTGNAIRRNSIFSNGNSSGDLGIDLGANGVTPNESGDGDSGANSLQNFPVMIGGFNFSTFTRVGGSLNSNANTQFTIEFFFTSGCDTSGQGEGQNFLGSTTVLTDATSNGGFTVDFSTAVPVGFFITATATDPNNNTSEFSACKVVRAAVGVSVTGLTASSMLTPACAGPNPPPPCPQYNVDLQATINNPGIVPARPVQVLFEFSADGGATYTQIGVWSTSGRFLPMARPLPRPRGITSRRGRIWSESRQTRII